MRIEPTRYYDEFLRYYEMARTQQAECNLGTVAHEAGTVKDDLMRHVHLYDVVNRKYAGFTQIILDLWYGYTGNHPYWQKLHAVRKPICEAASLRSRTWMLEDWLYVFIAHRVTGSGINYAKKPSGYNNTILPQLVSCKTIEDMVDVIQNRAGGSIYTSVGYQFPAFPKPPAGYRLGGDYFLCEYTQRLARDLADWLSEGDTKPLRSVGNWMFEWNKRNGLRAYKFQYSAVVADIADFFPNLVEPASHFFYGANAEECISYLARPIGKGKNIDFLDAVMEQIFDDTGARPYDAEDVCCDFIRWLENYVRPGHDYDHVDRDKIWNSSRIIDHPYGRQKAMLDMGLVKSFNDLTVHPSDDYVIRDLMTPTQYKMKVNGLD